jgi:hypothetical protein
MKIEKLIDYLKWFFAFAVFGVAVYAIYQLVQGLRGAPGAVKEFFKPNQYKKGKEQTWFEKNFPNVAEVKDNLFKPYQYKKGKEQTWFEKNFPNVAEITDTLNPFNLKASDPTSFVENELPEEKKETNKQIEKAANVIPGKLTQETDHTINEFKPHAKAIEHNFTEPAPIATSQAAISESNLDATESIFPAKTYSKSIAVSLDVNLKPVTTSPTTNEIKIDPVNKLRRSIA